MIGQTGIWTNEEAYAHDFSYGVARYIGEYFQGDKIVIDLGCGKGTYLQYLSDIGFEHLIGFEGSELFDIDYKSERVDLAKNIIYGHRGNVISLEVFEHIPKEYETTYVQSILNCCSDKLVISVAVEGQAGIGHVNCRNNDYVIDLFEKKGFTFQKERTEYIRMKVENHCDYFRNTLLIFER